jgi:tetratricopeptide (TPR) repeat protein
MLSKALELFGERPLICDHPLTVSRMRIESPDIQIIHVHGSYWFYDCCNLKEDIRDRSGNAPMSVMLDQSLRDHSPLVLGYSGWEGDILMSSLRRRLEAGRLSTPLYWFCYRRNSIDNLPKWLTSHNDVHFVLPDDPGPVAAASSAAPQTATSPQAAPGLGMKDGAGDSASGSRGPSLSADKVIDALVNKFVLPVPPLTEDPLGFYANRLKDLLGSTTDESEPDTYYAFHTVIARVERALVCLQAEPDDLLRTIRDAMSRADYRGAISTAQSIDFKQLDAGQRREVLFVLSDACKGLWDNSPDELTGYDVIVEIADFLGKDGAADPAVQQQVAMAIFNKGVTLGAINKSEAAIAAYDHLLRRFANAQELPLTEPLAKGLSNKGILLGTLQRGEEAIATYDELVNRFANATEQVLVEQVAMALFNKGFTLGTINKGEEEVAVYNELDRRFSAFTEPVLREQCAKALFNKGIALGILNKPDEEMAAYDELVRRFGDATELTLQEQTAKALLNKGVALAGLNKSEEALAAYDELLRRFIDAPEPALREQVARALINKGFRLGALNRSEEAIVAYDELIRRFGEAPEPALRERIARALLNKAARLRALNRNDEATAVSEDLLRRYADAPEPEIHAILTDARADLAKAAAPPPRPGAN